MASQVSQTLHHIEEQLLTKHWILHTLGQSKTTPAHLQCPFKTKTRETGNIACLTGYIPKKVSIGGIIRPTASSMACIMSVHSGIIDTVVQKFMVRTPAKKPIDPYAYVTCLHIFLAKMCMGVPEISMARQIYGYDTDKSLTSPA